MRRCAELLALALVLLAAPALGHEVRPAYLELREVGPERYDVLWKVPAQGERRLALHARLPERCSEAAPRARVATGGAVTERWRVRCRGGLVGAEVAIDGLEATFTDALVRIERSEGSAQLVRLSPTAPRFVVEAAPGVLAVARTYFGLGVEHIALGIDHLLFVLGLLILVDGRRRLIGTITAFTVAHSITLAASTLGWVRLAQPPAEAVIALSIVFVAGEIAHGHEGRGGFSRRWPWLVAGSFGLLHGFGFAGALREVGLPESSIPLALLCFNLGVEAGQLGFIAAVLAAAGLVRRAGLSEPGWAWRVPAYGIGSPAAWWTLERVAGFWRSGL